MFCYHHRLVRWVSLRPARVRPDAKTGGRGKRMGIRTGVVVKRKRCGARGRSEQREFLEGNDVVYFHK